MKIHFEIVDRRPQTERGDIEMKTDFNELLAATGKIKVVIYRSVYFVWIKLDNFKVK